MRGMKISSASNDKMLYTLLFVFKFFVKQKYFITKCSWSRIKKKSLRRDDSSDTVRTACSPYTVRGIVVHRYTYTYTHTGSPEKPCLALDKTVTSADLNVTRCCRDRVQQLLHNKAVCAAPTTWRCAW